MLRVVVDTNVLVSAALSDVGHPAAVVRAAFSHRFELVVSDRLLDELTGVLARPRIADRVPPEQAADFVESVEGVAAAVVDLGSAPRVVRDPQDDFVVALAIAARADAIVTGDADLHAVTVTGVRVVTPREFLDELKRG